MKAGDFSDHQTSPPLKLERFYVALTSKFDKVLLRVHVQPKNLESLDSKDVYLSDFAEILKKEAKCPWIFPSGPMKNPPIRPAFLGIGELAEHARSTSAVLAALAARPFAQIEEV